MSFYTHERRVLGVRIRAHSDVSLAALDEAEARVTRLLVGCPTVAANLDQAGAELHVIGEHQAVTDLPMYRHMRGVKFDGDKTMDERGRGYGGLFACTAEESLLGLESRRHGDGRDVCTHELAHTVMDFGVDPGTRAAIHARHAAAVAEHLWPGAYAATNPAELWAELSMWYVGSRGDYGAIVPTPRPGPAWLAAHDPQSYALLHSVYGGSRAMKPFSWAELQPRDAERSSTGPATSIVFVNHTDVVFDLYWVDYRGEERAYGPVPAHGVSAQSTYATHVWRVRGGGAEHTFVAVRRPGRVQLGSIPGSA